MSLDPTHIPDQPFDSEVVNRAGNLLDAVPESIGPYRILERIGTGGMGEVYRAEQRTPIRREVALKLIKLGMDTKLVIARFEAERQALALMDHPHIARVFDASADETGRPYFVMEYVKGKPITEYADHERLTIPERLGLFEQVCHAVQHAHHKGVIHRDLKPSNVLVSAQDGKPFAKVIDFGVAKAIVQRLTEKTFFTEHGQFVGTPQYMSPEQAEGNIDIDTRTDVYSLGVLLYELLTGSTPFASEEFRKSAFEQLKRMVIEVDPPKPSTRLQSLSLSRGRSSALREKEPGPDAVSSHPNLGQNVPEEHLSRPFSPIVEQSKLLETLALHRSTEPRKLNVLIRGELDWIVMKTLEKDRKRRYDTPSSLATDIRAHLSGGTVVAAPPGLWYRTRKFARKYKYGLAGAGLTFMLLSAGVIGTSYGLFRARQAEIAATESERRAIEARDQATTERDAKEEQRKLAEVAMRAESEQREMAERQLVNGLLRPIGYGGQPNTAELRSFVDWSAIPDPRLKLRIIDVALQQPEMALRVARRAERAIQASVALNPMLRAKAIELVSARQRETPADPRIRVAAAWLALELGSPDLPALPEALTWLSDPTATGAEPRPEFDELIHFITSRVEKLSPEQITRGADALIAVLETTTDWNAQQSAGNGLVALAPMLSPQQINRSWNALIGVLQKAPVSDTVRAAGNGLVSLAPMLSPEQITGGWDTIIGVLKKTPISDTVRAAGSGLVSLSPKLSPEQISRGWDALIGVLEKTTDSDTVRAAGDGLVSLAPKLSPEQITRGGDALIGVLEKTNESDAVRAAGNGLVALAPQLSPEQITRSADAFIGVLEKKTTHWAAQQSAGNGLVALAPKLGPEQITRGGDAIIGVLEEKTTHWASQRAAGNGLVVLASKLSPEQITRGGDAFIGVLEKTTESDAVQSAGNGLVALAPKLSPEQITRGWDALIGVLEKTTDRDTVRAAGNGLVSLAPKLSPEQITRGGDALIGVLEKSTDRDAVRAAGSGLVALAPKLSPEMRVRTAELMVESLQRVDQGGIAEPLNAMVWLLEAPTHERIATEAMTILMDYYATSDSYYVDDKGSGYLKAFHFGSMAMHNPGSLATKLLHPACVGEAREFLLQRFEELIFHDGKHVFLTLPESDSETETTPRADATGSPSRRFHTVHDAAAWIQQNWPEFDLEATHPVTWRGEM